MTETTPAPLRLPYQSPWHWQQFHDHHALRALPGGERLDDEG